MKLVSGKDGRNGGLMHAKAERSTREAACLLVRLAAMPTVSSAPPALPAELLLVACTLCCVCVCVCQTPNGAHPCGTSLASDVVV